MTGDNNLCSRGNVGIKTNCSIADFIGLPYFSGFPSGLKSRVWERSGSVVEYLTQDRGAVGSSLTGVTVLCP